MTITPPQTVYSLQPINSVTQNTTLSNPFAASTPVNVAGGQISASPPPGVSPAVAPSLPPIQGGISPAVPVSGGMGMQQPGMGQAPSIQNQIADLYQQYGNYQVLGQRHPILGAILGNQSYRDEAQLQGMQRKIQALGAIQAQQQAGLELQKKQATGKYWRDIAQNFAKVNGLPDVPDAADVDPKEFEGLAQTYGLPNAVAAKTKYDQAVNDYNTQKGLVLQDWLGRKQAGKLTADELKAGPQYPTPPTFDVSSINPYADIGKIAGLTGSTAEQARTGAETVTKEAESLARQKEAEATNSVALANLNLSKNKFSHDVQQDATQNQGQSEDRAFKREEHADTLQQKRTDLALKEFQTASNEYEKNTKEVDSITKEFQTWRNSKQNARKSDEELRQTPQGKLFDRRLDTALTRGKAAWAKYNEKAKTLDALRGDSMPTESHPTPTQKPASTGTGQTLRQTPQSVIKIRIPRSAALSKGLIR